MEITKELIEVQNFSRQAVPLAKPRVGFVDGNVPARQREENEEGTGLMLPVSVAGAPWAKYSCKSDLNRYTNSTGIEFHSLFIDGVSGIVLENDNGCISP
uniref:Uncharacterized protein n=1 Tax=Paramoeba aestuarina TaxID=180227 RepID=A0A7S4JPE4_9EUKA